ncbi:major facilitator superfamily MFS_1 [Rhizobium sp. PDO1-076]|uniref:MFS transporter n=1 Tax=Rhizobium sp. PDO1-076 TaxID=1125979 RepID=UPI00024E2B30|nr:MFS transporter [Rhizobium sp. PDO1-076]EHS51741.1 major facilitator superfamily MFS_1 [Rhizobium sp. PDO1-076]
MTHLPSTPRPRSFVLVSVAGSMLLGSLGISIATVALPPLSRSFAAPIADVQWVVLAYLLAVTASIVVAGRLGDLFGHGRTLFAGLVVFTLASIACTFAPTLPVLIAARLVQGLGGAALMAMPVSIIRDTISKERIGSAMGLLGTMSAVGTALGPSLGGILMVAFGWRAAFLALAGVAALLLIVATFSVPRNINPAGRAVKGLDLVGMVLLALSLTTYSLAMSGSKAGLAVDQRLLLPIALAAMLAFVLFERRCGSPLVPIPLLHDPIIGPSLATNFLVATVMMSTLVVGPFFLAFGLGLNDAMVGLVMAIGPLTAAFAGIPAGRLTDRFGAPLMLSAALLQIVIGLVCLALLPGLIGVPGYIVALVFLTPGFQLFLAANNTMVMGTVADERRGLVSGLLGLSRNLGFVTGASAIASLFSMALGDRPITDAPAALIGNAFTTTSLMAATLPIAALVISRLSSRRFGTDKANSQ